jgi:adenylyltransferase/sulfurtransferase
MIKEITVQELKDLKDTQAEFFLLDVRDQAEHERCNLGGYLIPLRELPQRIFELNANQKIVVHCKMGGRSSQAVNYLEQQGFKNVFNLKGGIQAWVTEIDPTLPQL